MSYDSYGNYGSYTSGYDTGVAAGGFLAAMGIILLIIGLVAMAIAVIGIIGQWKAFKKAGKNGWEAIVPIYNMVVCCQISGVNPWWVLIYFIGSTVLNIIPVVGSLLSLALDVYFLILLYVSVAKSYGKSNGFAAGLIFLSPFFWLVLGGKNTQYVGPTPMNDVVMNFVNEKILNKGPQATAANPTVQPTVAPEAPVQPEVKFCTGCGYKITNGERFCPGCGKEVQ